MALQKKFPTETEASQLEQEGFSQEQIDSLLALKALYTKGLYHEVDPERERREFIRWLYLQGRLQS
jgi:hypothetical protein